MLTRTCNAAESATLHWALAIKHVIYRKQQKLSWSACNDFYTFARHSIVQSKIFRFGHKIICEKAKEKKLGNYCCYYFHIWLEHRNVQLLKHARTDHHNVASPDFNVRTVYTASCLSISLPSDSWLVQAWLHEFCIKSEASNSNKITRKFSSVFTVFAPLRLLGGFKVKHGLYCVTFYFTRIAAVWNCQDIELV